MRQQEELRKVQLEQERAEAEAQKRRQEVELQQVCRMICWSACHIPSISVYVFLAYVICSDVWQRKAAEALRMAEMVKEQARIESEKLKEKAGNPFDHTAPVDIAPVQING